MWTIRDLWLRIAGIPLVAFVSVFFFYNDRWIGGANTFGFCYGIALLTTIFFWELNRFIMRRCRLRFPGLEQTGVRISVQVFLSILFSGLVSAMISLCFDESRFWGRNYGLGDYLYSLITTLGFVLVLSGVYESLFYYVRWRQSTREAEALKEANIQSQLESLKNQVSPHFLFNSLNTLSSLIAENPEEAVRFVNQLSRVYRYLLQSNQHRLTTVQDEIDFLKAYFFLLKTRFGEGLEMEIGIQEQHLRLLIPPLTLQILVENAVKHNVVSVSRPLLISLTSDAEGKIYVRNNLQKKTLNVISSGMGLANITAKYRLLNIPGLFVNELPDSFEVQIPLIPN